jgi:hypothetical protein
MTCQICFDDNIPIASNNDIGGALCRRSCTARVCVSCLTRHVETSLAGFYAGVLPLIRCPICLVPMRVSRWTQPLAAEPTAKTLAELLATYETLCKQACALMPPCCHKANYTHLPERDASAEQVDHFICNPDELQPEVIDFRKLVARFCGHYADAQDVLAYAMDHFKKNDVQDLVERTLPRIDDSERRARLLLAFLYKFPNIKTRCHMWAMCFNCKRTGNHTKCGEFMRASDESQCLVRCRNCRVMLMKVEGCNSVVCVCGFRLAWDEEVKLRGLYKKKMLPVDLFDKTAVHEWQQYHHRVYRLHCGLRCKHEQARREEMNAWILQNKRLVSRIVKRWVSHHRFTATLREMVIRHERIERARLDAWIQTYKPLVFRSAERWVLRIRFTAVLLEAEPVFFWRAYRQEHPEETDLADEEANLFFAIEV